MQTANPLLTNRRVRVDLESLNLVIWRCVDLAIVPNFERKITRSQDHEILASGLLDNSEFPADLGECGYGVVELAPRVGGGHLQPDARLTFGDDGIAEPDHINPFPKEMVGHPGCQIGFAQHDWNDRMFSRENAKPQSGELAPHEARIVMERSAEMFTLRCQFDRL